jgi:hypothetical protein
MNSLLSYLLVVGLIEVGMLLTMLAVGDYPRNTEKTRAHDVFFLVVRLAFLLWVAAIYFKIGGAS